MEHFKCGRVQIRSNSFCVGIECQTLVILTQKNIRQEKEEKGGVCTDGMFHVY